MLVATVVFSLIGKPVNALMAALTPEEPEPDAPTRPGPECLSQIPRAATRCAFCTSEVAADAA